MPSEHTYPIAEIFTSIQGEGVWTGTQMTFIRLAGCTVGKYMHPGDDYSVCTAWGGTKFACDTFYKADERLTAQQIANKVDCDHVCFTGGEPLMHNLDALRDALAGSHFHVETSGTITIPNWGDDLHVCCSPKDRFLWDNVPAIDEYKFLIGTLADLATAERFFAKLSSDVTAAAEYPHPFYVQPINELNTLCPHSLRLCKDALEKHRDWRLSVQLHKVLEMR